MKTWLTVFLILGLCVGFDVVMMSRLEQGTDQLKQQLPALRDSAIHNQWDLCQQQTEGITRDWDDIRDKIHIILRHDELESVEESMARLNALVEIHDQADVLAELAELEAVLEHLAQRYNFSEENLF